MHSNWKVFRFVCFLQILLTAFYTLVSLFRFFNSFSLGGFIGTLCFLLMLSLAALAVNLLRNNYPDTAIDGKQKKNFNRLFLLNVLFLAILFGLIFAQARSLQERISLLRLGNHEVSWSLFLPLAGYILVLIFQLTILIGLYNLRRELYLNFIQRKFEFERD